MQCAAVIKTDFNSCWCLYGTESYVKIISTQIAGHIQPKSAMLYLPNFHALSCQCLESCNKKPVMVQAWLCNYFHLTQYVFCVLIHSLKPSKSQRWPDQDLQWLAGSSLRNGPGWHVSAMINEQVFGSVLSKWSHYWWPQSSLCAASISDDFQAPASVKGDAVILSVREGLIASGPDWSVYHSRVKLNYLDWWPWRGKFTGTGALWQALCGLAVTCCCHED